MKAKKILGASLIAVSLLVMIVTLGICIDWTIASVAVGLALFFIMVCVGGVLLMEEL